ncbi:hypothetical protein FACS1894178_6930 [Bacteroidia bacterium]|nr:hypothetical protein FACS1894178_6930 [Bacteroidia bacterium]
MNEITDPGYDRLFSPTGVKVTLSNVVNATVVWEVVANADHYVVELSQPGDTLFAQDAARIDEVEAATHSYTNLTESVWYAVRVKAIGNEIAESKYMLATFKTTPPPPPETKTWNFSEQAYVDGLTTAAFSDTKVIDSISFVGGGSTIQLKTISEETIDEFTFTYKVDLGGGGSTGASDNVPTKRYIQFHIDKAAVVTVYAISGGAGRTLKLVDKDNNLQGSVLLNDVNLTPMLVNLTAAGDYKIFSAGSGIAVCGIKAVIGGSYTKSDNAKLQGLSITNRDRAGETENVLTPAFDPDVFEYDYYIGKSADEVTITTTKGHAKQVVVGDGVKNITADEMPFPIQVTAEDGTTVSTYTIHVHRNLTASNDATLKSLNLTGGGLLAPVFDSEVFDYVYTINDTSVHSVTLSGAANHNFATVGGSGAAYSVALGNNGPFTITVISEDHSVVNNYNVLVKIVAPVSNNPDRTWNFTSTDFADVNDPNLEWDNEITINGLSMVGGTGKTVKITDNGKISDQGDSFTKRFQFNGTYDAALPARFVKFHVAGPCRITVWGLSGSTSQIRNMTITDGTNVLTNLPIPDVFTGSNGGNVAELYYDYTGGAGDIYMYSNPTQEGTATSTGGLNLYQIKLVHE